MRSNTVSNSARFKLDKGKVDFFCVEEIYLDYSIVDNSCISNCGDLVPCNGIARSFTNKQPFSMSLVNAQIKKNCSKYG